MFLVSLHIDAVKGTRHTNLDCSQSSALGEPSVCALREDIQTKDWPGISCSQAPFLPSSSPVHPYLQKTKKITL